MKFIDAIGLKYFYDKLKKAFATLDSSGKVAFTQLPQEVKKVKYIKKERRNLYHKRIPLSFDPNNLQINRRYDDWYYSNCPVFRVQKGKKFRMFVGSYLKNAETTYTEAKLEDLTYWYLDGTQRVNLIEKSGDALICNNDSIAACKAGVYICPSFYYDKNHTQVFDEVIMGYHIDEYQYDYATDTMSIYISYTKCNKDEPWNKNLKWLGDRIECIKPTSINDVRNVVCYDSSKKNVCFTHLYRVRVKYYRSYSNKEGFLVHRLVTRHLKYSNWKLRSKINVMSVYSTKHHFRKQPVKFSIAYLKSSDNWEIKKLE